MSMEPPSLIFSQQWQSILIFPKLTSNSNLIFPAVAFSSLKLSPTSSLLFYLLVLVLPSTCPWVATKARQRQQHRRGAWWDRVGRAVEQRAAWQRLACCGARGGVAPVSCPGVAAQRRCAGWAQRCDAGELAGCGGLAPVCQPGTVARCGAGCRSL